MQIPILLGREIDEHDMSGPTHVAVVNELFHRVDCRGGRIVKRHLESCRVEQEGFGACKPGRPAF